MEIRNRDFIKFNLQVIIFVIPIFACIAGINYFVDASQVITSRFHTQMAQMALSGNIVAVPQNYNERVYQIAVINEMKEVPETVVIGCSRGMFLGKEITGFDNLYNNCVSGACMEDYYAVIGHYYQKHSELPKRVIIETSPWIFYSENPESRWVENYEYRTSANTLFEDLNEREPDSKIDKENPYFSLPYFQYNLSVIKDKGLKAFEGEPARISTNQEERADYPDGTIRYDVARETFNEERLKTVKATNGGVNYQNVNDMNEMESADIQAYENLVDYLQNNGCEVLIYMQPFSITQCNYIYDENTNPIFEIVENWLRDFADVKNIKVVGGFDSRKYNISDEYFIDFMHLDKDGTRIVWNSDF